MPRRVDQVQQILLTILCRVVQRHRVAFDRDATFAFNIHRIEQLILELAIGHAVARLNQAIGKRGLTVIDMGDDAKISNVFHGYSVGFQQASILSDQAKNRQAFFLPNSQFRILPSGILAQIRS